MRERRRIRTPVKRQWHIFRTRLLPVLVWLAAVVLVGLNLHQYWHLGWHVLGLIGAAAVVVMSAKKAEALGLTPLARIKAYANAGVDPKVMGMGPVPASKRCLERAGWSTSDLDLMEINEAFAAQALAVHKQMGWDTSKVNVNGGAIAIGHPIGASGCRILVTLLYEMQKRDAKRGLASLCIGGGMGVALAVERA